MLIKIIFDRTGVLIMLNTPLAGDRTGVRSVAGSDFIYNVTKNSARPRFDFNMCTRGACDRSRDLILSTQRILRRGGRDFILSTHIKSNLGRAEFFV